MKTKPTSRRKFFKQVVAAAAVGGIIACEKDEAVIEELTTPTPKISGPTELTIPKIGKTVQGTFTSDGSRNVTKLEWKLKIPDTDVEPETELGSDQSIDIDFSRPGSKTIELTAYNSTEKATVSHEITINPPDLPEEKYDLPLAILSRQQMALYAPKVVYLMDPNTLELTTLFKSENLFDSRINWEPNGKRIFFSMYTTPMQDTPQIASYNLLTGEFKILTNITSNNGSTWAEDPSCDPTGEWLAFTDNERIGLGATKDIAIMKLDGSNKFYLSKDATDPNFTGTFPTWNNDGSMLAAGNNLSGKVNIFKNLFNGDPVLDHYLPTINQLIELYNSGLIETELSEQEFVAGATAGIFGNAWSPDGNELATDLHVGESPNNYDLLIKTKIDGSETIEILAMSKGPGGYDVNFFRPISPTWTPDGKTIFFSATSNTEKRLYKVDTETKNVEPVMGLRYLYGPSLYD